VRIVDPRIDDTNVSGLPSDAVFYPKLLKMKILEIIQLVGGNRINRRTVPNWLNGLDDGVFGELRLLNCLYMLKELFTLFLLFKSFNLRKLTGYFVVGDFFNNNLNGKYPKNSLRRP
jgi:hypothetical protein